MDIGPALVGADEIKGAVFGVIGGGLRAALTRSPLPRAILEVLTGGLVAVIFSPAIASLSVVNMPPSSRAYPALCVATGMFLVQVLSHYLTNIDALRSVLDRIGGAPKPPTPAPAPVSVVVTQQVPPPRRKRKPARRGKSRRKSKTKPKSKNRRKR
jgi:hypothetical protein